MDSPGSDIVDFRRGSEHNEITQVETPDITEQASPINEDDPDQPQRPTTGPMQKRRRVTRACDECRRKKIKCDGKQPCTHCTVYSYGM
jgi:hypothetical protein